VESGARPNREELLEIPMISKRIELFNENKEFDIIEERSDSLNKNKFTVVKNHKYTQ
jgi:hypothetical protein